MSAEAGAGSEPERIAALDGIRGFAVLWVMLYHFLHGAEHHHWLFRGAFAFTNYGHWGVDVFFVLSGFLITGILYDSRQAGNYFSAFYARRSLRIFPLYYCVLLGVFVLTPLFYEFTPEQDAMAQQQGWLWAYLGNIAMVFKNAPLFDAGGIKLLHFWSLAIEEQFYLVWPAVVLLFGRRALMGICVALVVVAAVSRVWIDRMGIEQPMASFFTLSRVDGLALGAMAALIVRGALGNLALHRLARILAIVFAVLLAVTLAVQHKHGFSAMAGHVLAPVRLVLFVAIIVMAVVGPAGGLVRGAFSMRWLVFFGKYSYALYVFHYMMLPLFERYASMELLKAKVGSFIVAVAIRMAVCTVASIVVALLSWHLIEKHFLKLKKYFVPGRTREKVMQPATVASSGAGTAAVVLED